MAMTPAPDPQLPPSIVTRAIGGDEIADRSACNLAALHAVVTAAAERRVERRSARILKTGQRNQEWPVLKGVGFPPLLPQHRIGDEQSGRSQLDHRPGVLCDTCLGLALAGRLIGVLSGIRSFSSKTSLRTTA
jgi:hypothetical protein